ncbi:MAG: alanine--glyoxylate aminotransferase family protein [Eubacterium sp.]|nr:alanine--glyoxylate aminotransferase family protein [Candidatus Colimonas fimequi]
MSKLYTLGPVEMHPEILEMGSAQVPYFRNQEFSDVMLDASAKLMELAGCDANDKLVVLTASGTAGMEATVMNCFHANDNLLVIDGGSFGHRFVQLCQLHKIPHTPVEVPYGETLTEEMIVAAAGEGKYTGLLVNIHESGTGQHYDIDMLSAYCKKNDMYFVVDAISSFLCDALNFKEHGIDALILSSQKALSLAPGLSFVALSERMVEKVNGIESGIMYLDFKDHLKNMERGQTPFTPAVRLAIEWQRRVNILCEIGIDKIVADVEEIALDFRSKLGALGLEYPSYPLSNAGTPVLFPEGNALVVYEALKNDYGYTVNPSGGELGKKLFRVAHMGNHTVADNDLLLDAIKEIMNR